MTSQSASTSRIPVLRRTHSRAGSRRRVAAAAALLCALSITGAACTSDTSSTGSTVGTGATGGAADNANTVSVPDVTTTTHGPALTTAQASTLARILLKNHEAGGAKVDGDVQFGTAATFHLVGVIDWKNGIGRVELTTIRSDGVKSAIQTIAWGGTSVFLSAPGLTEALAAKGRPGITFLQRPVSIKTNPLDQIITLIATFSSARADNPLLLRQGDTSFEGLGTLNGKPIQKLRFGRSVYSVADDGFAYQLDVRFKSIDGPIVMRFSDHGPQNVEAVDPAKVLPFADFSDLYNSLL